MPRTLISVRANFVASIANECRRNIEECKSQSISSIRRLQIYFAKTQSRFRSRLESRARDQRMREIEKLSTLLDVNLSHRIYHFLVCTKKMRKIYLYLYIYTYIYLT